MLSRPLGESWLGGTPLLAVAILGCGAGFLLFGYDQGVANALQGSPDFYKHFPILKTDTNVAGAVFGMFVLGAFFGSLLNWFVGNRVPRRLLLFFGTLVTVIGGTLQAASYGLGMFIFSRILNGIAVGVLTAIVPPYLGELTKPKHRGRIVSFELVMAATGLMTAFWVSYGFGKTDGGPISWRIPLAIQPILALITLTSIPFSPESPRWLCEKGRFDEAKHVLTRLYGAEYAEAALLEIREAITLEQEAQAASSSGLLACFANNPQCYRYRTLLSMGVNLLQQLTGVNMSTYYAFAIFHESIGLDVNTALLCLGGLGIAGLAATAIGCYFLDGFGRIRTLMMGSLLCCIGQVLLAAGVANIDVKAGGYAAATGLYLFLCAFSYGWLAPSWLYASEISPLAIRTRNAGLGAAVQYIFNFMVVEVTPSGIATLGYKFYIIFAVFNAAMIPILYFFFPEVSGLSLEAVDTLFIDGKVTVRHSPRDMAAEREFVARRPEVLGQGKAEIEQIESYEDKA